MHFSNHSGSGGSIIAANLGVNIVDNLTLTLPPGHPDPERLVNVQGWDQGASEFWRKSEEYTFLRCSRNFSDAPFKLNRPHLRFQILWTVVMCLFKDVTAISLLRTSQFPLGTFLCENAGSRGGVGGSKLDM